MNKKKDQTKFSKGEAGFIYSSNPKTHIFYEYEGERAVDPLQMIADGITLWHEQMLHIFERDTSHLWNYAEELLATRNTLGMYPKLESLRYEITLGLIVPKSWSNNSSAYPYKWMLISAIYFQEARRLCEKGSEDRAWHVVAMAYYHLGLNTHPSPVELATMATMRRHAMATWKLRALVVGALEGIEKANAANSIEKAKEKLIQYIARSTEAMDILEEYEGAVSDKTKHNKSNNAIDRLAELLTEWAGPRGSYPEIRASFLRFKKGKTEKELPAIGTTVENIQAEEIQEGFEKCVRIVNHMHISGCVSTIELSRESGE